MTPAYSMKWVMFVTFVQIYHTHWAITVTANLIVRETESSIFKNNWLIDELIDCCLIYLRPRLLPKTQGGDTKQ